MSSNILLSSELIYRVFQPNQPVLLCRLKSAVQEHIQEDNEGRPLLQMRRMAKDFNNTWSTLSLKLLTEEKHGDFTTEVI